MAGIIQQIDIGEIVDYYENPRHAIATSEEETLKKLFEAVGNQYMLNLAEDILQCGLLGNQQIVVVYSEALRKYVVYEGNRRVAAIKLLLNPENFSFLDKATINKAETISRGGQIPNVIPCYVTDEQEAFFIMERLHSGEDKGRGTKKWTAREKESFKVRQSHEKNISYLIDFYTKKYFDELDITTILPFTTIQRIFNNREVKQLIGLDVTNEKSFTPNRMQLVIDVCKWIVKESDNVGSSVTRLFNKARTIEDKLLPWINEYTTNSNVVKTNEAATSTQQTSHDDGQINVTFSINEPQGTEPLSNTTENIGDQNTGITLGGSKNLPYFFQGLNYSVLDPKDADSHGVSAVCRELQLFSDKKLVTHYPIASAFLVRALIEQSIIYYSKKHKIQAQNKLIWENIKGFSALSKIIENYKKNLANYITDDAMRKYFISLFGNYEDNVDPLNWVVHKPAEFQLDSNTLIELPRKGLLTLINFMIS